MGRLLREINRQMKAAAREAARREREQDRRRAAAMREAERAQKADERAAAQLARAYEAERKRTEKLAVADQKRAEKEAAAERKRLEREAKEAHLVAMEAKVEQFNAELASKYEELDGLLGATLEVDDYVDLDGLRRVVEHPSFDRSDLERPVSPPVLIVDDPPPTFAAPPPLTGLGRLLGKRKHDRAVAEAKVAHERAVERWEIQRAANEQKRQAAVAQHARHEATRREQLEKERGRYAAECEQRESDVAENNAALERLKVNLAYGATEAVEEYIDIVLANSIYPEWFPVTHRFKFEPTAAELDLTTLIPPPSDLPNIKAFKYQKSADQIEESPLPAKACKDRYLSVVEQVALRTLHEVFEADRRGLIQSISLTLGTETVDPATGLDTLIPFVSVAAERESFMAMDLSRVVPSATLAHLGAAVSKSPYDLVAADVSGVRRAP